MGVCLQSEIARKQMSHCDKSFFRVFDSCMDNSCTYIIRVEKCVYMVGACLDIRDAAGGAARSFISRYTHRALKRRLHPFLLSRRRRGSRREQKDAFGRSD